MKTIQNRFTAWWYNEPDESDPENKFLGFGFAFKNPEFPYNYVGINIWWEKGWHWPEIKIGKL